MSATHFIEQYIDRNGKLFNTGILPIEKLPQKVNTLRKSRFKTVAFWKMKFKENNHH